MTTEPIDGELKYLAGLYEGEGSSIVGKRVTYENKHGIGYQAQLVTRMTDIEPVRALYNYFGGYFYIQERNEHRKTRTVYTWAVISQSASNTAKLLMPYILTPRKRGALQCVIDYVTTMTGCGHPVDPEIWCKREDLYQKCKAFNARGINANNRDESALEKIEAIKTETAQLSLWA